jgi:uncharacterized protein
VHLLTLSGARTPSLVAVLALAAALGTSPSPAAHPERSVGVFVPVDPAEVKVGGEIGRRIDLTIQKNLLAIDVDHQFLSPFRQKQSKLFDYVGLGKLIDATVSFAYYTRDPKVIALKDHLIKELIASQLADGYLGTFPAAGRIHDVFDEHEIVYNIHALVNDYRRFHSQPSLDAARKVADYLIKNYNKRDPKISCKIDTERAMIALSDVTGDSRYRRFAADRVGLRAWHSPIDVVNNGQYSSGDGHAYTFMNTCLAQLDLYHAEPNESLFGQSRRVIDYLTKDDGLMITGECGLTERFRNNQETHGEVGESCATGYLIRLAHHLLQLKGDTLYGDLMERTIYNALFAAQSPDGRTLRYYTAIDGPRAYYFQDSYCCPGNWRRTVAELPEMVFYRSAEGGVMVNLYASATGHVPLTDGLSIRLRQQTDYPNSGSVRIDVAPSRAATFPVTLRIPRWCRSARVSVNGQAIGEPVQPGGWCSIKRQWTTGDSISLEMPMPIRLVRGRKLQSGKVAVMRGPVVFCFSPARQAARYPVYAGRGANPAEIQRSIDEAVSRTKFDWSTLGTIVPDKTVRPDGLALEVRGWGPTSDAQKPADLTFLLTEFIDATGQLTYMPGHAAPRSVDDELRASP